MKKDFDIWSSKKKAIHNRYIKNKFFYNEREVWYASVGVNVGVEINGKGQNYTRPVLVIKKFNKHHFWGIPITSKYKSKKYHHEIMFKSRISYVNITQLKTFSSQRLQRKIDTIRKEQFNSIIKQLKSIL